MGVITYTVCTVGLHVPLLPPGHRHNKMKDPEATNRHGNHQHVFDTVRTCNCSCKFNKRSESFYDIFLSSSVKATPEYRQLLVERHNKKMAKLQDGNSGNGVNTTDKRR